MKQQTAIQELMDYINDFEYPVKEQILLKATELLQKEQDQITIAYYEGVQNIINDNPTSPQEYFSQTYNNQ